MKNHLKYNKICVIFFYQKPADTDTKLKKDLIL